ncbi:hypothetical protein CDCA_CDCA03G0971 [Cyanidium caldarium]|uniref:3-methyl-2-oxobutanoate dehydrogenase (2-methylpropanoyl-transferring) n=1 Tax=Cyanidium caldarium TaxID=2771 RepID=A0AAV9IS80_CYACA|nr:hypothetical protein CDCA_CDCA03G0971 [Cyanidium caldarium]
MTTLHRAWSLCRRAPNLATGMPLTLLRHPRPPDLPSRRPLHAEAAPMSPSSSDTERMNLFMAVQSAMAVALETDPKVLVFGEDVAFGGVFRCTMGLRERFGPHRVFNTPLSEQGIAGFAAGLAAMSYRPVAEIQFADYMYPAFDQVVNEIAKYRYRSGGQFHCGGLVLRAPYGAVGHGGHYHSQSPEAYFVHTAGLKVVIPRDPVTAKGLLLQSIREDDPVIFLEPKVLYRAAVAQVPRGDFTVPLGEAQVLRPGRDITLVGYGAQVQVLLEAAQRAHQEDGIDCEVIDLMTLLPWDERTVVESVRRTGRCIVSHEAPVTGGFGAEVAARIQQECFLSLECPVRRVCGYDMPFPLVHEKMYVPSAHKVIDEVRLAMNY